MNSLGIQFCVALLGFACCLGEVCAQGVTATLSDYDQPLAPVYQYTPPAQPGIAADVPTLPPLSIAKANLQQNLLTPPPRKVPIVRVDKQVTPVAYQQPSNPSIYPHTLVSPGGSPTQAPGFAGNAPALDARGILRSRNPRPLARVQAPTQLPTNYPNNLARPFGNVSSMPNAVGPAGNPLPSPSTLPLGRNASWGYPQDPDDPFGQLQPGIPSRQPSPANPTTPPNPTFPPVTPRVPVQPGFNQDPQDPFQELPGNPNDPTPRPRPGDGLQGPLNPPSGQQDIEPRPLPNGQQIPPTQLPIPPRERTPVPPNQGNQDNGNQGNGNGGPDLSPEPFVYPESVVPGQQTYPGVTSVYEPNTEPGEAVPIDTSQTTYGPSRRAPSAENPNSVLDQQYNPGIVGGPSVEGYAPTAPDPQIAPVNYEAQCQDPCGWRPELAIGLDPKDPSFEPLFYLSLFGGLNSPDDFDGADPAAGATSSSFSLDDGFGLGVALGQYQGYNLRTEFEYSFRHNDVDQINLTENVGSSLSLTDFDLNGEVAVHSGMGNVIWQFRDLNSRWIRPYVGAGAGFAFINTDINSLGQNVFTPGSDSDSAFAYQLFGGINTQLSRQLDVFIEYRYFATSSFSLETDFANVNGGTGTSREDYNYSANNVFFGVRLKF